METKAKPRFNIQENELKSQNGCLANVIKIDEEFLNYFIESPTSIEEAKVTSDFTVSYTHLTLPTKRIV